MEYTYKWYFLRWVVCLAECAAGFLGAITLGFWQTSIGLSAEGYFLDYSDSLPRKY